MSRKKKLLFLITKSNWGGAQRYVYDLATSNLRNEYEVSVALGGDGELSKKLSEAGVTVHKIERLGRDIHFTEEATVLWQLIKLFWQERPDIVHVNSSKIGGLGAFAARVAGVPKIVFTAHGWPFNEARPWPQQHIIKFFSWLTVFFSTNTIVVGKADERSCWRWPFTKNKVSLVYNGIGPIKFGTGAIIRKAFPAGVKITGTIGELTKNKNQISLVKEAGNNPDMYVAIVGEGEERNNLEQKIAEYMLQDRVKLFGFVPASEALPGFDTFTLPSLKEGLPYVLLEAKMAGLPIIANRVGAVAEILDAPNLQEFTLEKMVAKTRSVYEN
ncbi:MAG: glycosyltransferase [Candidatus Paceibacterota bacterium]|jgi:glycosyltransferase involved in cell wall biosynthesis